MVALPPLVDSTDLNRFGYDPTVVTDADIERASARVRRHTRQEITSGTSTVKLRGFSPLSLPQRPVRQVTSVTWADGTPVADYTPVGSLLHLRDLASDGWRMDARCQPVTVIVDYDHGYAALPDGLIELVCSIAARFAAGGSSSASAARAGTYKQLTVGSWSATYSSDAIGAVGGLLPSEKAALTEFFPKRTKMGTVLLS